MSIVSFIQDAGEKLFKRPGTAPAATPASQAPKRGANPAAPADVDALNRDAAEAIRRYLGAKGMPADALHVGYDGATSTVTVSGPVPDQDTREKIVLLAGNVANVHHVNDQLSVASSGIASDYYVVQAGDTLSKLAQHAYGSAKRYSTIFDANRDLLSDPDKIQPGQTLRIPRLS